MVRYVLLVAVTLAACGKSSDVKKSGQLPSGDVTYTAPAEWITEPPANSLRKAQFRWPGDQAADAEMAVFFFPGAGGSVDANLDRWYSQFLQPDGSTTKDKVEKSQVTVGELPVTVVYVGGTYKRPLRPMEMGGPVEEAPDYALKAAIVETANGPWFFKAVGPKATIDRWKESFDKFVQTFIVKS